jgi:hypothetical protein
MGTELDALTNKVVSLAAWQWEPGMLTVCGVRVFEGGDDYLIGHRPGPTNRGGGRVDTMDIGGFLPDLTDPATVGCLLHRVRGAHKAPRAMLKLSGATEAFEVFDPDSWSMELASLSGGAFPTEVEALVAALEQAP